MRQMSIMTMWPVDFLIPVTVGLASKALIPGGPTHAPRRYLHALLDHRVGQERACNWEQVTRDMPLPGVAATWMSRKVHKEVDEGGRLRRWCGSCRGRGGLIGCTSRIWMTKATPSVMSGPRDAERRRSRRGSGRSAPTPRRWASIACRGGQLVTDAPRRQCAPLAMLMRARMWKRLGRHDNGRSHRSHPSTARSWTPSSRCREFEGEVNRLGRRGPARPPPRAGWANIAWHKFVGR